MTHPTQDMAAARLADRVAKGLGTPYAGLEPTIPVVPQDYGVFAYADLPNPTLVPPGSRATVVNAGPVWSNGVAWVGAPAYTVPNLVALGAPMTRVLDQRAALTFTAAAGTFTNLTATTSTGGTKTRLTSSGAHGLTASENGFLVHVSAAAGITAGAYAMTYVSSTAIDIAVPYTALTTPVVGTASSKYTFYSFDVPADSMGANGIVEVVAFVECSATATAKSISMKWGGGTTGADVALNGNTLYSRKLSTRICNQNDVAAQRVSELMDSAETISQAAAASRDTTDAQTFELQGFVVAAGEFIRLSSVQAVLYPHA